MKAMRHLTAIICVCISMLALSTPVHAAVPYKTFSINNYGLSETQTAYEPVQLISKIGDITLKKPADMRLGPDGNLYIADTGASRIVVSTLEGELVRIIGEGVLNTPKGVFVADDMRIYVADEKKERVFVFSPDGELQKEYGKPSHPLFGTLNSFKPQKVVVDKRGNLNVVSLGNTNGIIQISPQGDGEFLGYFGANTTKVSLITMFRKAIFTDDLLARMNDIIPINIYNLSIDDKGLIYTVSQNANENTLKKLNMAGNNIITADGYDYYPVSVTTGAIDNIFVVSSGGFIYEYSSEGDLLFLFGGTDDGRQRIGLFKNASAIAVDSSRLLYVLDEEKADIQVFAPTEFTNLVHEAYDNFQNGRYIESKEPWQKVLEMNSLFDYANHGLGEAQYREEDYSSALTSFKLAGSYRGYSDTFWELRSDWMRDNMVSMLAIILGAVLLIAAIRIIDKRLPIFKPIHAFAGRIKGTNFYIRSSYLGWSLKNPADAHYRIKREKKVSYLHSMLILFAFFLLFVVEKYASGFLFRMVPDGYFDLLGDLGTIFGVFGVLVVCCYLVCTITEGETSFKELFCGAAYCLAPLFIFKPIVILLTNVLTYNEVFLLSIINFVAYGWTALLVFLLIKNLNDYTFKGTFKTIFLTAFTALIVVLLGFVVYVLISQVIDFIAAIFGEVVYRIESL